MRTFICCLTFFISLNVFCQSRLNDYKFIIVSEKLSFLKKKDEYKTSSLTKFLFNKNGFRAFFSSDALPKELINNNCDALYVDFVDNSGMFSTVLSLEFKDCLGKVIYTSQEGKSRKKEYKVAYYEAIRNAFKDTGIKKYKYIKKDRVADIENDSNQIIVDRNKITDENADILYAQKSNNGYQLIDTTPKVVFKVLSTSEKDIFIIENKKGILSLKDNYWIAEFYEDSRLIVKKYFIKF